MSKLLAEIKIPNFIDRIKLSEARRAKYYEKGESKKLSLRLQDKTKYDYRPHKKGTRIHYFLTNLKTGEIVLANPRAAGTPKYNLIRGNDFYAGFPSYMIRDKIMDTLKEFLLPYFAKLKAFDLSDYPLYVEFIYSDLRKQSQDLDNKRYAYEKAILDVLQKTGSIINDTVDYITKLSSEFVEIKDEKDRLLTIKFYSRN